MWYSNRSGRVYSDPVEIDGLIYVDIIVLGPNDPIKPDEKENRLWGKPGSFPQPHMIPYTKEPSSC